MDSLYEIFVNDEIVGPLAESEVKRGWLAGRLPESAHVRRIGDWRALGELSSLPENAEFQIQNDGEIVGPVTLGQVRRGIDANRIPDGSQNRVYGKWVPAKEFFERASLTQDPAAAFGRPADLRSSLGARS